MKPCKKGLKLFTTRQVEIIQCSAHGMRAKDIADKLGLSVYTVNHHIRGIYFYTPALSMAHAVALLYGID